MKIGIVTQSYYPRFGGVTEHVHYTALELRRRGHEVTIITGRYRDRRETDRGVERIGRNVLIPFNGAFVDFTVGLSLARQLRERMRAHDFDIVHTHIPNAPTLPLLATRIAPCAQVGTFHTASGRSLLESAAAPIVRRSLARLDARIAVSPTALAKARQHYPGAYSLIPNGVDVERFHPGVVPFERWRDPRRLNVLFVGRLDPRKGLGSLLRAMPEVIERTRGRARLLVVGDSYLRPRFESMVPPAARADVHFLGHVPAADLPRWYATGDLFVSPATGNESFGIVLLEAMASGRAVLASDIPGYRTVIQPGENGVVFPPGEVPALAQALVSLVGDDARRRALAERGRARALEFAWPLITARIEDIYRSVLERRGAIHSAA